MNLLGLIMLNSEKLKKLILAHKEGKDELFNKIIDSIILEEEASNRFHVAKDLKNALAVRGKIKEKDFSTLRTQVESMKNLVFITDPFVDETNIFLNLKTKDFLDRLYIEHSNKKKLLQAGLKPKNRLLFYGPPGTGKTLTAHYIATILGLPLCIVQLSNVVSSLMGDTASNLAKIFTFINSNPCVLLIDEFDTFAKSRNDSNDVGELQRIVNTLLQNLDSFNTTDSVVIAATNYDKALLDSAVWRRFDGVLEFELPSVKELTQFLQYTLNGITFNDNFEVTAKLFKNFSYAEIKHVLNESLKTMIISNKSELRHEDIKKELVRLSLGKNISKNKIITKKKNTKLKK